MSHPTLVGGIGEAIKLLTKKMKDGGDLNLSETMWNAIIAAVTDESAIYDPMLIKKARANGISEETLLALFRDTIGSAGIRMPTPEFSLEELEQAEEIISGGSVTPPRTLKR